jgi:nitrogen regulatory protein PII-like uncharacterized protein
MRAELFVVFSLATAGILSENRGVTAEAWEHLARLEAKERAVTALRDVITPGRP